MSAAPKPEALTRRKSMADFISDASPDALAACEELFALAGKDSLSAGARSGGSFIS